MAKRYFEAEFQEMMVQEAARDRRLLGTLQWLLLGETTLVAPAFLDSVDEAEVAADIGEYYALDSEGVQKAFELCEDGIMGKLSRDIT